MGDRIALRCFLATLAVTVLFPLLVAVETGLDGLRLALCDLGFSFFQITLLPVAVGSFATAFSTATFLALRRRRRILWLAILGALFLLVGVESFVDARRPGTPPYLHRGGRELVRQEVALRKQIFAAWANGGSTPDLSQSPRLQPSRPLTEVLRESSASGYLSIALNILCFWLAGFIFLYLIFLTVHPDPGMKAGGRRLNALTVAVTILLGWFPLRLFSEWHNGLYVEHGLFVSFEALMPIVAAALLAVFLMIGLSRPRDLSTALKAFVSLVPLFVGLAAWWKPAIRQGLAQFFSNASLLTWIFTISVGIAGLFGIDRAIRSLTR